MGSCASAGVSGKCNQLTAFHRCALSQMRRFLQVIVDSVPVVLMLQNQGHTTRRPVAFLHHNTISRSRQRCPHRECHVNAVVKSALPCYRMNPPPKRASSVHAVPFRPGLREPHDLLPCYFRPVAGFFIPNIICTISRIFNRWLPEASVVQNPRLKRFRRNESIPPLIVTETDTGIVEP